MLIQSCLDVANDSQWKRTYFESSIDSRVNRNLSKGSLLIGDYAERDAEASMSVVIDSSYSTFSASQELPYQELRNLLISWLKDPSDHDVRYWPDIERGLKESIKFRDSFE